MQVHDPGDLVPRALLDQLAGHATLSQIDEPGAYAKALGDRRSGVVCLLAGEPGLELGRALFAQHHERPLVLVSEGASDAEVEGALAAGISECVGAADLSLERLLSAIGRSRARARSHAAVRAVSARYEDLVSYTDAIPWEVELPSFTFTYVGTQSQRVLGYPPSDWMKPDFWQRHMHPDDREWAPRYCKELTLKGQDHSFEYRMIHADGSVVWIRDDVHVVRDASGPKRIRGFLFDITHRKLAEASLKRSALFDALTGLPNRALFRDRVEAALGRAQRRDGYGFAVLLMDVDRFQIFNDSLGLHDADRLLVAVARRLSACLRPADVLARAGGDEFSILVDEVEGVEDAVGAAHRLHAAFGSPFSVAGRELFTSASIGIAMYRPGYERPVELLRDADIALNNAKRAGRARHEVYVPGMHDRAVDRLQLEMDLRRAIERREFKVFFQPIVSSRGQSLVGFEALVRWDHPARGLLAPSDFLDTANETGLIVDVGRLVLREALGQVQRWQSDFGPQPELTLHVNSSTRELTDPDLVTHIDDALAESGFNARNLRLEITEDVMSKDLEEVIPTLMTLRERGIHLQIDDFGTGFSSLSRLHRLPLDALKIDRSFVAGLSDDPESREIVNTIMSLARNLNLDIVAEGVESTEQLKLLRDLQVDLLQGFLFSHPVDAATAEQMVKRRMGLWPRN